MHTAPLVPYKNATQTRGFTLVETLVAITIFVTVIVGPLTIAWSSMQSAYFANEQTTAIFLAQEALESIRLQRDNQGLETYRSLANSDTKAWEWLVSENANNTSLKETTSCTNPTTGCDLKRGLTPTESDSYISCPSSGCQLNQYVSPGAGAGNEPSFSYGYGTGQFWKESPYRRKIVVTERGSQEAAQVIVTVTWTPALFKNVEKSVVLESWLYNQYKRYEK